MLKKIIFRPFTFVVILMVLIEAMILVLPQQVFGMLIDTISSSSADLTKYIIYPFVKIIAPLTNLPLITQLIILYLLLSLLSLFISILRGYCVTYNGERILFDIRKKLFSNLIRSNYTYLNTLTSGETTLRILSDVENVRNLIIGPINGLLIDLITVFLIVFICFRISAELSILMLIPIPIVIFSSFVIGNKQIKISTRLREHLSNLTSTTINRIKGFLLVKLFAQENKEDEQYSILLSKHFNQVLKSLKTTLALFPLTSGVRIVVTVGLLYVGILRVQQQVLSVGELLVFIQYLGRFYSPFVNIARFYNSIAMSIVSYKKLANTFLETERNRDIIINDIVPTANYAGLETHTAIEFDDVTFSYCATDSSPNIIESMSFKVMRGEKVSIVGESGKGKTTVLNLIVRLISPQKGKIKFNGIDICEYDTHYLRSKIGYLTQNNIMYNIPLIDNVRYGVPDASIEDVVRALSQVNMQHYASSSYLFNTMGEGGELLSGGEKQRVAIARLALCNPDVILLDEPIANLDIDNAKCVMDLIFNLFSDKTIIITSHQPLAISYSTRSILI
ncbi:ABC transporter ATP-binding protein [Patescibacteria group bacterium]|nr:ABC transporter ATP-binding protein [Patescibacteria group bacterium]HRD00936.1 ABC transporter ATP-binding protein [Candidatus Syntrophosphaera thermopropionivorans]